MKIERMYGCLIMVGIGMKIGLRIFQRIFSQMKILDYKVGDDVKIRNVIVGAEAGGYLFMESMKKYFKLAVSETKKTFSTSFMPPEESNDRKENIMWSSSGISPSSSGGSDVLIVCDAN